MSVADWALQAQDLSFSYPGAAPLILGFYCLFLDWEGSKYLNKIKNKPRSWIACFTGDP